MKPAPDARGGKRLLESESDTLPPLRLLVRIEEERCQLSLEAGGWPLYHHGWRTHIGAAPLRESIAASLLSLTGWEPGTPLLDLLAARARSRCWPPAQPPACPRAPGSHGPLSAGMALTPRCGASCKAAGAPSTPPSRRWSTARTATPRSSTRRAATPARPASSRPSTSIADVADLLPPASSPASSSPTPSATASRVRGEGERAADKILINRFAEHFPAGRSPCSSPPASSPPTRV